MVGKKKFTGFTLIEVLVVMGIIAVIFSLSVLAVLNIQKGQLLDNHTWAVVSLLRQAQNQALNGVSVDGTNQTNFGVHFDDTAGQYTLFRGDSFDPSDPYNFTQSLPSGLSFHLTLPSGNNVIFNKITGRVGNYNSLRHFIRIRDDNTGDEITIDFNQEGAVDVQ